MSWPEQAPSPSAAACYGSRICSTFGTPGCFVTEPGVIRRTVMLPSPRSTGLSSSGVVWRANAGTGEGVLGGAAVSRFLRCCCCHGRLGVLAIGRDMACIGSSGGVTPTVSRLVLLQARRGDGHRGGGWRWRVAVEDAGRGWRWRVAAVVAVSSGWLTWRLRCRERGNDRWAEREINTCACACACRATVDLRRLST